MVREFHIGCVLFDCANILIKKSMKAEYLRKSVSLFIVFVLIHHFFMFIGPNNRIAINVKAEFVFSGIQEISIDYGTETQSYPDIAIIDDKIHVVWVDKDIDYLYYRYYDGNNWNSPTIISNISISGVPYEPAITVEGNYIHVVWEEFRGADFDIFYRGYNGSDWLPEIELSDDTSSEHQFWPRIAASNGKVHVVWCDEGGGDKDIIYRKFNGVSWEPEIELNTDIIASSEEYPDIDAQGNEAYAVWDEYEPTNTHIYYRHFNGVIWEPEQKLLGEGYEGAPRISVNGSKIYIVFGDSQADMMSDVHMFYYNGTGWEPEKVVATGPNIIQRYRNVAANSTCAHIVWEDETDGTFDIFYRSFNGTDFSPIQEIDQEQADENHYYPAVAAYNEKMYVVWEDQRDGDSDIYMTLGTSVPQVVETSPLWGEKYVMPDVNITINFTHSMDKTSVEDGFILTDGTTVWTNMDGVFLWADENRSCTFIPSFGLDYSTNYTVVINATAMDKDGKTLDGNKNGLSESFPWDNYYWNFTTISPPYYLEPGWNLISLPKLQSTTDPTEIFKSIKGEYDTLWHYNASDSSDHWKVYDISKPPSLNDLENMNHTMGIWIHITNPEGVNFYDYGEKFTVNQSIILYPGWNLVGFPSNSNQSWPDGLNNLLWGTDVHKIQYFNTSTQRITELIPSDNFEISKGYWIYANLKKEWDVPL